MAPEVRSALRNSSTANDKPCPFTRLELRRALNYLWSQVGWSVQVKSTKPFRLRIYAPQERAKRYFRNDPGLEGPDGARAVVAQAVRRIVENLSRAEYANAVIDCSGDGARDQLDWFKNDALRRRLMSAIKRGGAESLRATNYLYEPKS